MHDTCTTNYAACTYQFSGLKSPQQPLKPFVLSLEFVVGEMPSGMLLVYDDDSNVSVFDGAFGSLGL